MATHHPSPTRTRQEADSDPNDDADATVTVTAVERSSPGGSSHVDAAIERELLRAHIRALERELLASERHRQGLINQYERLLAEREEDAGAGRAASEPQSLLGRLFVSRE